MTVPHYSILDTAHIWRVQPELFENIFYFVTTEAFKLFSKDVA
jgi:hypothetical protein